MRKLFTFLCAALMSVGMFSATVVTITDSDFPGWGDSFTKDGVTVSAEMIDDMYGNISGPGSFSTTLGNFTKIEVNANYVGIADEGWSGDSEHKTWTGNASSVSFTGDINGDEEGLTLKFTIEESAPEPQPAEPITVTWNSYDLPSSGSSFTKDGVTMTCDIDDDLYGPGTFTTDLGNFTQIVVSGEEACYIDATDGWSGNIDQKTWTGNAASVSWGGAIYSFSSDVTIVFTIEPASTPEPQPAGQVITWDFNFCNEVTAMCDDGATIALDNSKDGISVTYGGYDDMDGWGGGYIYLYGASESKMIFSSTVGDISKIEIYYSDNIGGTPADWTLDATNNKFVWEGTPAASVDMKKGSADNIGFAVDHIVFTIGAAAPTAIENVQSNKAQSTKFFRNGQLLIEKNGKIYNVQGVEVR